MFQKLILPFVETMATQACNLSCLGCSNYSDLKHSGYTTWPDIKTQIEPWLEILEFPDFGIIGGEPLVNPEIEQWIVGIRELLPNSQIRFTTNGLLLKKYPNLLDLFNEIGNCVFKITVHKSDTWLEDYIQSTIAREWKTVVEYGITRLKNSQGVRFQINRPTQFVKTYQNNFYNMKPYNNNPVLAFDNCFQQTCPLLHQGKIYKCSTAGLLAETLEKVGRPNWEQWEPLIDPGISINSDFQIIQSFVENFGKPHIRCSQCPSATDPTIIHLEHV